MKWYKPSDKNPPEESLDLAEDSPTVYLVLVTDSGHLRPCFGRYYKSKQYPQLEPNWYIEGFNSHGLVPDFWTKISYPKP